MFCIWADYPGAETEQEVAANIRLVLRAMALRMEGVDLDGMNTDVVPGGFNADGSINSTGEQPHEHQYEAVVTAPTCTEGGYTTYTCECGESYIADETEALGHDFVNGECSRCDAVMDTAFEDVPVGSFYFDPVQWAVEQGITNGVDATHFGPNVSCNRAQVVTFLWRANGQPASSAEVRFSDVQAGQFYTTAVAWAVEKGITNGMDSSTFGIGEICNRAQVVTFLYRAHK